MKSRVMFAWIITFWFARCTVNYFTIAGPLPPSRAHLLVYWYLRSSSMLVSFSCEFHWALSLMKYQPPWRETTVTIDHASFKTAFWGTVPFWYNCHGWLDVKNQLSVYDLSSSSSHLFFVFVLFCLFLFVVVVVAVVVVVVVVVCLFVLFPLYVNEPLTQNHSFVYDHFCSIYIVVAAEAVPMHYIIRTMGWWFFVHRAEHRLLVFTVYSK